MLFLLPQGAGGASALLVCWLRACASTHDFIHSTPKHHAYLVLFACPSTQQVYTGRPCGGWCTVCARRTASCWLYISCGHRGASSSASCCCARCAILSHTDL